MHIWNLVFFSIISSATLGQHNAECRHGQYLRFSPLSVPFEHKPHPSLSIAQAKSQCSWNSVIRFNIISTIWNKIQMHGYEQLCDRLMTHLALEIHELPSGQWPVRCTSFVAPWWSSSSNGFHRYLERSRSNSLDEAITITVAQGMTENTAFKFQQQVIDSEAPRGSQRRPPARKGAYRICHSS